MEIIEKDFKLTPIDDSSPFFDLELLYTVKPRGGEARTEFRNAGYGLTLKTAIKKIVHYKVCNNHRDEAIELKTYFNEYKKELDELIVFCKTTLGDNISVSRQSN